MKKLKWVKMVDLSSRTSTRLLSAAGGYLSAVCYKPSNSIWLSKRGACLILMNVFFKLRNIVSSYFLSLSLFFIAQKQDQNLLNNLIFQMTRDFSKYFNNVVKSWCIHSSFVRMLVYKDGNTYLAPLEFSGNPHLLNLAFNTSVFQF